MEKVVKLLLTTMNVFAYLNPWFELVYDGGDGKGCK